MKIRTLLILLAAIGLSTMLSSSFFHLPSWNDKDGKVNPGCRFCHDYGRNNHVYTKNTVSVKIRDDKKIEVTCIGVRTGKKVAGELVNDSGRVVDVIESTTQNPFLLQADKPGKYIVYSGYGNPAITWDSTIVIFPTASVKDKNDFTEAILYENYPNPFNTSTYIYYYIENPAPVKLTLSDMNGNIIKELVNEVRPTGIHTVTLNGKGITPGIYNYTLQVGKYVISKKMVRE